MKVSVRSVSLSVALAGLVLPVVSAGAATLTIDTTEPTGAAVVIANPHTFFTGTGTPADVGPLGERDTFTTVFSPAGGFGSRGQTFLMPDNPTGTAWDVSALTIRADANASGTGVAQNFSTGGPHALRLWVFAWSPVGDANDGTQWTGDGSSDGDPFDGTSITSFAVNGEAFDVTRTFGGEFLHFSTPGVQFAENTAYGLLLSFESAGTTGLRLDETRDQVAPTGQTYAAGGMLRSQSAANDVNNNGDDLVFYVEATAAVPEPAGAALFGLASLMTLATRRRRR